MVENELEAEYVMQYIDIQKQIISIWRIMIKTNNDYIISI